jgi:predicted neutral ceramidase superfamily lipid hydrolase
MRKAILTGFFTGIIISAILISATYLRRYLPGTLTANVVYRIFFFGAIATVLWVSLNIYCRNSAVKWMTLGMTGIISSIIAAILVSIFRDPLRYAINNFSELMVALILIPITISSIYYLVNKKRLPEQLHEKNHELIF